jgi:hypothetical protein
MNRTPAWWFVFSSLVTVFLLLVWVVYAAATLKFGKFLLFEQPLSLLTAFSMFGMFASGALWLGKNIDKWMKWEEDPTDNRK